ncbi:uncharacterized protein PGRI_083380 [Penicillium griseofulvum]|uniref:Uncharacterized protein n=1 Tax=Penicillium patulum TaxID=5078 RepID=A0A135LSV4_PENPA|nr:uncharacterized protein PGRI_083380 [Penicillium griseofulvum]KXG52054.1 hypothetical protein PGRI_083380 [Penicillium griseofulvum]
MGIIFSSDLDYWRSVISNHAQILGELQSWRRRTKHGIERRCPISFEKVDDVNSENYRLRADIAALSTLIDQSSAELSHWKAEVEAIPANFHDILSAEVNTMNTKYHALSTKVGNGFNNSTPAINQGLAIGLPLGLGIPLTIAVVFLCVMWIRRRYAYIPLHMNSEDEEAHNYTKVPKKTRHKNLPRKLCDLFEALGFETGQVFQEVYVMHNTPNK